MEKFTITKIRDRKVERVKDVVAQEVPFTININDKELVTLLCSPSNLEDLTRGFLFTSGLIKKAADIEKIVLDTERWTAHAEIFGAENVDLVFKRLYTSGCGMGTLFYNASDVMFKSRIISDFRIEASKINILIKDFQKRSGLYLKTGGVHSAALAEEKGILAFREDIGRHNAIDKVVGYFLLKRDSFKDKILITSGRISSEVIQKARKCGLPVVISKSAATNQAVRLARELGITLLCFVRGNRMNIYSSEERIIA